MPRIITNRLYYSDSYLKAFDAIVTACRAGKDGIWVALNQSAFYPTSGGQPFDTGTLNDSAVTDVEVINGEVWHKVAHPFAPGEQVHGEIDWERRFDHMQQHGGEHMLAGEVWTQLRGMTIGLHLGLSDSSIDVELPDGRTHLTHEELFELESAVNRHIHEDAPVKCWFPDADELAALPLRKPPTVSEHIRIVAFGDYEMVACGGTHPASAGQVGCVKILSALPSRGKVRLTFVCGMRAVRCFQNCFDAAQECGRLLSCQTDTLVSALERTKQQLLDALRENKLLQSGAALQKLENAAEPLPDGTLLSVVSFPDGDRDAVSDAVGKFIKTDARIVLVSVQGMLIFARSASGAQDMSTLIRQVAKGGGKKDFASGKGDEQALQAAAEIIKSKCNDKC